MPGALIAIPYGVLVLPALVMAVVNRWLPLALSVLAVPVTLYFWYRA